MIRHFSLLKHEVLFVTFALHEAVKQNNAYITSKLLFFGAEPMMKDTWGKTAFDYAKSRKYEQILQVFEVWRKSVCWLLVGAIISDNGVVKTHCRTRYIFIS